MDVILFPVNLLSTSDLSILMHGVSSLPDATSHDKHEYSILRCRFRSAGFTLVMTNTVSHSACKLMLVTRILQFYLK